ncbi:MAG: 2,3-bisphosphoglycerate-independent phosphoglycerate mutase [Patescibacteria group bacterium]|nr:2,3-bisphosphoglycerate-independent phosphoglycerate mutase [Patescibacteria group bacterium]
MAKRQVILTILDGWGIGAKNDSNPIYIQGTPNIDYIKENFLMGSLQASGISVGLPWNEEGNSEVGHLTIGAGRVLYQHYPRITLAIRDGSFAKNKVFLDAFEHVKKNNSALNLAGLLTEGNIHASYEHLVALIALAKNNGVANINLHLFCDGKDSAPRSFLTLVKRLTTDIPSGWTIGSIAGRYYALDRDNHWDHTQLAYNAMTGAGPAGKTIEDVIKEGYDRSLIDQYIEPHTIAPDACVKENDALLFFDFREDGIRQLATSFIASDFSHFPRTEFSNLYRGTFTRYHASLTAPVAFPEDNITMPLGRVLSENGKTQLRIAETEKYAHVTYFFNGYREEPFPNEYRVLIPSERVKSFAEKPKMRAAEITARVTEAIREHSFDFILANLANGDMVAHTGNFEATKIAVKTVDESVGALVRAVLEQDAVLLVTGDHGNAEVLMNPRTGEPTTTHDPSPVPIYIVGNAFTKQKSRTEVDLAESETIGILSDVAPTVLELLQIPKPKEMTGESLLRLLE